MTLRQLVLEVLSDGKPNYGLIIAERVKTNRRSRWWHRVAIGARIYPLLRRMENDGQLVSHLDARPAVSSRRGGYPRRMYEIPRR